MIPVNVGWVIADINVGILYIFAISSLSVYGIIMAGWASNSKYPFLAALRSAAQMVSYEVSIGFVIITVLLCVGSLNLSAIVDAQDGHWGMFNWYWLPLFPMFVIFFVSALAETNRPPFDLVEAESELVAGFMVEYGSTPYLLFMLGEYVAIATMCAMATILFLGGWLPPVPGPALHLGAGRDLVHAQGAVHVLHVRHGEGDRAALPLRPADAAGLEGVSADLAGHGGDRRGRAAIRGAGAEMTGNAMIDISLGGLLGAIVGTVVAALVYGGCRCLSSVGCAPGGCRRPRTAPPSRRNWPCCAAACWRSTF